MRSDILLYISFLLIIISCIAFASHTYISQVNECTRDPIKYGVEEIRDNYSAEIVKGNILVFTKDKIYTWDFGDEIFNLE